MRTGQCYGEYRGRYCLAPRPGSVTRQSCCCTMGQAWSHSTDQCHPCPSLQSDQFKQLCPLGPGRGGSAADPEDFNECDMIPGLCEGGTCINTDGSYRCSCSTGYKLDSSGEKCVDVDECLETRSICGNGTCSNVEGGFQCQCSQGFAVGLHGEKYK